MFGRGDGCGCDDFIWIIILIFIICCCCGNNNGCDRKPVGPCC